jgi:hypothetical protein
MSTFRDWPLAHGLLRQGDALPGDTPGWQITGRRKRFRESTKTFADLLPRRPNRGITAGNDNDVPLRCPAP